MYAFIPWNPDAGPQWERALKLLGDGVPRPEVIRRTGIAYGTFYQRLRRERALHGHRPRPARV